MDELIKEIEENKENIKIDYILEKLKNINTVWEYVKSEIIFNIESLINENYMEDDEDLNKIESLNNEDINRITDLIYNQDWLFDTINETMNETIEKELYNYIHNK